VEMSLGGGVWRGFASSLHWRLPWELGALGNWVKGGIEITHETHQKTVTRSFYRQSQHR
jgi:hypothetical protein